MAEAYSTYCDAVSDEVARIAEIARDHDPATPVPSCPDWTLAGLVRQGGLPQQWFAAMITRRSPSRLPVQEVDYGLPAEVADYPDWLASRHVDVAKALRAADPDAEMWTWGPGRRV